MYLFGQINCNVILIYKVFESTKCYLQNFDLNIKLENLYEVKYLINDISKKYHCDSKLLQMKSVFKVIYNIIN